MPRDQPVDVVAVERRDEGRVQQRDGLVRDLVGGALDVADALDQRGAVALVVVVRGPARRGAAALDDQVGVAIEQARKTAPRAASDSTTASCGSCLPGFAVGVSCVRGAQGYQTVRGPFSVWDT